MASNFSKSLVKPSRIRSQLLSVIAMTLGFGCADEAGKFPGTPVLFSDANIDTGFSNPESLSGVIVLNDDKTGKMPRAEFNVDTSGDDIRIW